MQNTELAIKPGETNAPAGAEKQTVGDYVVSYRTGPAQGMYEFSAGKLEWKEPQEENVHLDVMVYDAKDGRLIPGLTINATLLDKKGGRAAATHLPFVWHPKEHHYGANVKVPESGEYLLQVHIFPATFPRAGKDEGERYVSNADVQFESVRIEI